MYSKLLHYEALVLAYRETKVVIQTTCTSSVYEQYYFSVAQRTLHVKMRT
jgi:hypothetical protein